ncbi:MAG: FAD-dependent monooxygenase [Myxococcota bacterium]
MTAPGARKESAPVLIVGAGPSGMVSALCLAELGVPSVLVERSHDVSLHPKAHEVNARSIEILVGLGFSLAELEAEASPAAEASRVVFCRTLGDELGHIDLREAQHDPAKYARHLRAAQPYLNLSQTALERRLLARVRASEAVTVLFGHRWERGTADAAGITSVVTRCRDGATRTLRTRYVVGADGAASLVRAQLGIAMEGPERLQDFVSAYVEMDLSERVATPAKLYWLLHPEAAGTLIAHRLDRRWVYHLPLQTPYERPEDFPEEVIRTRLRKAIGDERLDLRIRSIRPWRMTAQVATHFRDGRWLLVGDAAHRFPPTGGLGMNTGIADAHNLAWKLAAVVDGRAGEALLDTYERERRPVAQRNCAESLRNFEKIFEVVQSLGLSRHGLRLLARVKASWLFRRLPARLRSGLLRLMVRPAWRALRRFDLVPEVRRRVRRSIAAQVPHFDRIGLDIGYVYAAGALVPAEAPGPPPEVTRYVPSTHPGARFPHVWLDTQHARSTHDALSPDRFTLLVDEAAEPWRGAAAPVAEHVTVASLEELGESEDAREALRGLCGLGPGGALLVRPDGHVAWRQPELPVDPERALGAALAACHLQVQVAV